jgi:nicotinate-nucleotide adenylyltransferase
MRQRVGIFGGTFDPPHVGHVVAAACARHQLGLDEVWVLPAGDPWQKTDDPDEEVSPAALRLEMARMAFEPVDGVVVRDLEVRRSGRTYAIDTVEALGPDVAVTLILGADTAAGLDSWHRSDELADLVEIAWFHRAGHQAPEPHGAWKLFSVDMPALEISSTAIRAAVAAGRPIDGLVPPAVVTVLRRERLYRWPR